MQAPVQQTGDDGFTRQARTVQEEQCSNGDVGEAVEALGGGTAERQHGGQDDGGEQGEGEVVRSQSRPPAGHVGKVS